MKNILVIFIYFINERSQQNDYAIKDIDVNISEITDGIIEYLDFQTRLE